jgi:hypothetical protein
MVIIGGSDESSTLNSCELYYPTTDTYYSFPSLKLARENASSCIFIKENEIYIYCFGGFDKKAIDGIERIKLTFSTDADETLIGTRPIIESKWDLIKNAALEKSVECCGTFQISDREIIIFGGFQNGESKNT